jgi:maltose O-acetyltransferase
MLIFLWNNRCRPLLGSKIWLKQWAKRIWTLSSLILFAWRIVYARRRGATIGEGTLLSAIHAGGNFRFLCIGQNSFIGRVDIQLHSQVEIGSNVCINDGVRLITASHDVRDPNWKQFARPIRIGDHAWIATGAVIMPGVTIGRGAVVGACAIVTKDVPDYAVATGNPARIRENIRCHELDYSPTDFIAFQTAWRGQPAKK